MVRSPDGKSESSDDGSGGDLLRCLCGSLLARRVPEGIELKCRRCKRTLVVPLLDDAAWTEVHPGREPGTQR